jgi:NAD(P)-dependent dehydrogenase (short-subunit alcohol dehydrogenase family)
MLARGGGTTVNIASILGWVGFAGSAAAKHGVLGLTQTAAIEHATQGIGINSIGPAFIMTPLLGANLDAATQQAVADLHPMKRMGTPAAARAVFGQP